jgi:hypothetical protein
MKTALVILGMHRSGTSTIAGLMNLLGYYTGKDVLPASDDNQKGVFENEQILDFNESMLNKLYLNWYSTYLLPVYWYKSSQFEKERKHLTEILVDQFAGNDKILLKDPRICILLPLYLEVFNELEIVPKFIITLRHPDAVASSLAKRNRFSPAKCNLLWLDHVVKSEYYSRNYPRLFLQFTSVLNSPDKTILSIIKYFELAHNPSTDILIHASSFVNKGLNHYKIPDKTNQPDILTEVEMTWALLKHFHLKKTDNEDYIKFDTVRGQFYFRLSCYQAFDVKYEILITLETKNGTSVSMKKPAIAGNNHLVFDLETNQKIKSISLEFTNQPAAFIIENAVIENSDGSHENIIWREKIKGVSLVQGIIFLESEMPRLFSIMYENFQLQKIILDIAILSASQAANQLVNIKNWETKARYLEIDKQLILNSFSWKLGNFLCSPIKLFYKIFFSGKYKNNLELYRIDE